MPASFYIVTYDRSADKERDRVAHVLEGFEVRARFWLGQVKDESSPVCGSVFECRLTRGMKERLLRALGALQVESRTIHLYPARSDRKPTYLGPPRAGPDFTERSGDAAWIV